MNILFIGPYRQADGWGYAAHDYVKALLTTEHNIAIRPIYMANRVSKEQQPDDFLKAEKVKFEKVDIVIQNVIPKFLSTHGPHTNIALSLFETNNINHTSWVRSLNQIDYVWTLSKQECSNIKNSGVTTPTICTNGPINTDKYKHKRDNDAICRIAQTHNIPEDTFKFYFIGEYIQRKNIVDLLIAFYREFNFREKVDLVIKTNRGGVAPHTLKDKIFHDILNITKTMRMHNNDRRYKRPIIITDHLTDIEMNVLHQQCNCFVMPSCGESFCRPAIDAMGFGNIPIGTDNTGMTEFINKDTGWLIPSMTSPIFTNEPPMPDIYTTWETWERPNVLELQKCMREAYELSKEELVKKQEAGREMVKNFSYKKVGENIDKAIREIK